MISKKLILTATLILSIILTSFSGVYASSNPSGVITLSEVSSKPEGSYKVGDEVVIQLSIAVKEMDGVNILLADVLGYDSNVLKYNGVKLRDGWSLITDNGVFFIERRDLDNDVGKLCELKFKVIKEFEETTIYMDKFDISSGDGTNIHYLDGTINSPSIKITATKPAPSAPKEETQIPQKEIQNNKEQEQKPGQSNTQETVKKEETKPTQEPAEPIKTIKPVETTKKDEQTTTTSTTNNTTAETQVPVDEITQKVENAESIETQIQNTTTKIVEQEIAKLSVAQKEKISEEKMESITEIIISCVTKVVSAIVEAILKTATL